MRHALIIYSTTDGQALKICKRIQQSLEFEEYQVLLQEVTQVTQASFVQKHLVVLGASIRYGRHSKAVERCVRQFRRQLDASQTAFFSVNLVARKPHRNTPQTNPYFAPFLSRTDWQPIHQAVFAGRLHYAIYGFWDKWLIRFIMKITGGPTELTTDIEYTDWQQVEAFTRQLVEADPHL